MTITTPASSPASRPSADDSANRKTTTLSSPAYSLSYDQVLRELQSCDDTGLSADEVSKRQGQYGPNDLGKEKAVQPLQILVAQVANAMTLVLLLALAASFAIQAWIEGGVLAGIILVNIVIGYFQDLQAARTIASLNSLNSPRACVVRDGHTVVVEAATLVPGDIIELKTGDSVPADARLLQSINLEADEAALTGESVPVRKNADLVLGRDEKGQHTGDIGPGDRLNVVFSSTTLTKGRGRAVVFATAMDTEIGAIAVAVRDDGGHKRKLKRAKDGSAALSAYMAFVAGRTWDEVGAFLGLTVGTPLQKKLSKLFFSIFGIAIVCALIVIAANKFSDRKDVIIYAIGTALGTLPVTLVLVLTITMAAGTKVMVGRQVLVRNMTSLEALGGVTNICSDKTGTLTQGKMVARMAWLPGHGTYSVDVASEPYNPESCNIYFEPLAPSQLQDERSDRGSEVNFGNTTLHDSLRRLLDVASLANLSTLKKKGIGKDQQEPASSSQETPENGEHELPPSPSSSSSPSGTNSWVAQGDPTEIALQVLAARFGRHADMDSNFDNGSQWKHVAEFPFDSTVKMMSMLYKNSSSGELCIFTKGAVERVIDRCGVMMCQAAGAGKDEVAYERKSITAADKQGILDNMEAMARRGLRVLALASRTDLETSGPSTASLASSAAEEGPQSLPATELKRETFENSLILHGLVGIYDPPRPESRPSVLMCQQAGISVHMLTGDHPETARAIASEVGILPRRMELLRRDVAESIVMAASEFDSLTDDQLDALEQLPLVVARCAPSTKVRMIEALHRRGRYIAMTGDGVNDSPSLHRADVGIAMGLGGSDVAKSASDIVLTDDNFASILNAVEEGRRIFDNIQKFMLHVLAANVGFVTSLLVGLVFRDADNVSVFLLTPVEILFMLLVAGAFTETGLGFEAASPDVLRRPPHNLKYGVFTPEFLADILGFGIVMATCMMGSFVTVLYGFYDGALGEGCNLDWSESCSPVFKARSTCYTVMMWTFLAFGWELVDSRRSFFDGILSEPRTWFNRLWRNPFLFWSVIVGVIIVVPTLYIPVLNHVVFQHEAIDKEWGIVFAFITLFMVGAEGWKWAKRVYLRRNKLMMGKGEVLGEEDLEARAFQNFFETPGEKRK